MDVFSALGQSTRRNIMEILAQHGELSATDISNKFQISAPAISQHLKVLREAKLIDMEKKAQQRLYTINRVAVLEIADWAEKVSQKWNGRFDKLEEILKKK